MAVCASVRTLASSVGSRFNFIAAHLVLFQRELLQKMPADDGKRKNLDKTG
jgi:hypothetical protein